MDATTICTDLHLPECPRWRDGALWFSDMWGEKVHRLAPDGTDEIVLELDDDPGGLGWLPDGDLLVVGMEQRKLWRWDGTDADPARRPRPVRGVAVQRHDRGRRRHRLRHPVRLRLVARHHRPPLVRGASP